MAITYFDDGGETEVASGNITITMPDAQENDLLIAVIGSAGNAAFTAPAGWNTIVNAISGNTNDTEAGAIRSLHVAWRLCPASPPADYTFTRTGGSVATAFITSWRGNNKSAPFEAVFSQTEGAAVSTHTSGSGVTTTEAEELILGFTCGRIGALVAGGGCTDPSSVPGFFAGTHTGPPFTRWNLARGKRLTAGATGAYVVDTLETTRCVVAVAAFKSELSVAISPAVVGAAGSKVDPSVRHGSITIEPNVVAKGAVVPPSVVLGSLTASPASLDARGVVVDPLIGFSSTTVSPTEASASGIVVDPAVKGELIVSPNVVEARGETSVELIEVTYGPLFSPQLPTTSVWTPQEALS